ncbi:hypothetical protein EB796_011916 [Bugula neritina]|uniref:TMC domain-containing protein n=1 Tax=Bugula neritina TaxID=10212 RepID=A0A7J7JWP8_BUGNE|nr:hypothetical protein EB796_011916 [Bugula neritina]
MMRYTGKNDCLSVSFTRGLLGDRLGEKLTVYWVIDFLIGILVTLISEVMYRVIAQFCCQKREEKKREEGKSILPQYDIARNTMALIYNQFLLWLGIYYCPLLTVVVVIKLWLTFYMKRVTVMNACIPTTKPWRAAKMHTIFLIFLFIGFIFCAVLFGLALVQVEPSANCGPFTNQTKVTDVITDTISDLSKESQIKLDKFIMNIIFSPGVVFGVIVILCVAVHYVRVASTGRKTLISLLKIQITLESKDKAYLRHMLERVQKHKSSRRTANACNCDDTCSCDDINGTLGGGDNSTTARTRDGKTCLVFKANGVDKNVVDPNFLQYLNCSQTERRLFAKQRRSTTALESFHENRIPSSHPSL